MYVFIQVIGGVCYAAKYWIAPIALPIYATINFFIKLFFPALVFAFCYIGMALSLKKSKVCSKYQEADFQKIVERS